MTDLVPPASAPAATAEPFVIANAGWPGDLCRACGEPFTAFDRRVSWTVEGWKYPTIGPIHEKCQRYTAAQQDALTKILAAAKGDSQPAAPSGEAEEPRALREAWKSIRQGAEGNGARLSARECQVLTAQATELDALHDVQRAMHTYRRAWEDSKVELAALRAGVEELDRYARHTSRCSSWGSDTVPCTCGLTARRAALAPHD